MKSKYDFVKIILFGSYAKGNYNEDSDIDITNPIVNEIVKYGQDININVA